MIINHFGINIDLDNPSCLYCKTTIDTASGFGESLLSCDLYICSVCKEGYTLGLFKDKVSYIIFTCKQLELLCYFSKNYFEIKNFWIAKSKFLVIPSFQIDFSDKETLYKKLSTYLIFS